jgi:sensor histidine kinase regulating citrate/malate metabolism
MSPKKKEPFDHYYFFESMAQNLDQVKNKLLISRRRLAHEFEQAKALMSSLQEAVVAVDLEGRGLFFNGPFVVTFLESTQVEPFTKKTVTLVSYFSR